MFLNKNMVVGDLCMIHHFDDLYLSQLMLACQVMLKMGLPIGQESVMIINSARGVQADCV